MAGHAGLGLVARNVVALLITRVAAQPRVALAKRTATLFKASTVCLEQAKLSDGAWLELVLIGGSRQCP